MSTSNPARTASPDPGHPGPTSTSGARHEEGPTVLVAGCGDLGTEVALRLAARGEHVLGLRRNTDVLPSRIDGLPVDLTTDVPDLPPGSYDRLAVVLTADGRDAEAYRETYVGGLRRVLEALQVRGVTSERAVLVSSTGVYGDTTGELTEASPVAPTRATHEVLLEAEALFARTLPHGTVLRLSGLYGPGRSRFVEKARRGEVEDSWTNRIHRDDAAAAIVHLLTDADSPAPLHLGSDRLPAHALDVADEVRALLGLPPHPDRPRVGEDDGRRLVSDALAATGFAFTYPTYREGYAAVLGGHGRRHP
ncbi:NAD(P)H-binding protein [Mobilicoccus pelagius]|uniref:NAD-dependent epimerase/dehydratase family protein n=1 Tax=Mobilicoccus pelagius NBRC 104925 TaxID=1089455 RepID=H5UMU1_9MICO|nr:NAD(P)H-binding protein [Mobilicoccus pelagius]GAB47049.1 NAD-dependent epimerase/dehydratase family protein [Mobilicoccus pelagius NBRC 104925]